MLYEAEGVHTRPSPAPHRPSALGRGVSHSTDPFVSNSVLIENSTISPVGRSQAQTEAVGLSTSGVLQAERALLFSAHFVSLTCTRTERYPSADLDDTFVASGSHREWRAEGALGLSGLLRLVVSPRSWVDNVLWHVPSPAQNLGRLALSSARPDVQVYLLTCQGRKSRSRAEVFDLR